MFNLLLPLYHHRLYLFQGLQLPHYHLLCHCLLLHMACRCFKSSVASTIAMMFFLLLPKLEHGMSTYSWMIGTSILSISVVWINCCPDYYEGAGDLPYTLYFLGTCVELRKQNHHLHSLFPKLACVQRKQVILAITPSNYCCE